MVWGDLAEHCFFMLIGGLIAGGFAAGLVFYKRFKKQLKKQNYQLNTIEELYKEVQRASGTIDANVLASIESLARALEARDAYTRGHSDRVNKFSMAIGRIMGLSKHELEILHDASLLHDIGKIGVPDRILLKPTRLTEEEYDIMKSHAQMGADILSSMSFLREHVPLIRWHHERQDGKGYPDGLRGSEIPIGARIIQVADTWDAMTSNRPYRRALSNEVAASELIKYSGTQFDADVVDAFISWLLDKGMLKPKFQPSLLPNLQPQPTA